MFGFQTGWMTKNLHPILQHLQSPSVDQLNVNAASSQLSNAPSSCELKV